MATKVAETYGRYIADIHESTIRRQVLGISFDGDYFWRENITVEPSKGRE